MCCLQETEVQIDFPENILNCNGYNIELEQNTEKKRAGIYIHKDIKYVRRMDLEKPNCHVVIIDIRQDVSLRIINVYRSFRPHGMSPLKLFETQLNIMQNAITSNCFILGDFNLDARMEGVNTYNYKQLLYNLTNFATENNFQQIIDFSTWSRVINGVRKESLLDHVYVNCLVLIKDVQQVEPVFGDHVLATVELHSRSIEKTKEIYVIVYIYSCHQ